MPSGAATGREQRRGRTDSPASTHFDVLDKLERDREPGSTRTRSASTVSSSLGGEQSPWKYRVSVAGNGGRHYGLVDGARPWSRSAAGRWLERDLRRTSKHRGVGDNGRRATAAVMRCGCRRGECFEGYEPRCGERRVRSDARIDFLREGEAGGQRGCVGKRSEPFPDRDATGPRLSRGANRRGGVEPRGRNVMCSGWRRHTEGRWRHLPGVDARERRPEEGNERG